MWPRSPWVFLLASSVGDNALDQKETYLRVDVDDDIVAPVCHLEEILTRCLVVKGTEDGRANSGQNVMGAQEEVKRSGWR